ncbi:RNA polymerase sigma-70 factor [Sphingobacterium sp. Mn56C]|uniref:RNA polymerase sigma-70 factor n=1 Tax=Sphingobacterium sp. Mn56C TaxID=3395261 RepID=UPI003BCB66D3
MKTLYLSGLTDEELLARIQESDHTAFEIIFDRFAGRLLLYAVQVIHKDEDAKDIVQEVLLSLWQRRATATTIQSLSAYLYSAIRFKGLSYVRNNLQQVNYLESLGYYFNESMDELSENLDAAELEEILYAEIDKLPARMREIFHLSRIEHLSHKEIATRLGISELTVKKQINLALKHFRQLFGIQYRTLWALVLLRFLLG